MKKPALPESKKQASDKIQDLGKLPRGHAKALFIIIEKRLKSDSQWNAYISPKELVRALRANLDVPLPPEFHNYLCDFLEGKIKKPSGRPPDSKNPSAMLYKLLIPIFYERYYTWLNKRKKSIGIKGCKPIQKADWWQGPPNERAARMTCRRLVLPMDWRRVLNFISESKKDN